MLRKYGVNLYIYGHDHCEKVLLYKGLNYVGTGAGGPSNNGRASPRPPAQVRYFQGTNGFISIYFFEKSATLTVYGLNEFTTPISANAERTFELPNVPPEGFRMGALANS